MKPHKHAELIKAWADGAEIEARQGDSTTWVTVESPTWSVHGTYRIKPTPKPDVVVVGKLVWDGLSISNAANRTKFRVAEHWETDNIKLTFDGETGKLKSAEVI
jgi:hypothetical protein